MTQYTQITVAKADGIATITLNRPDKMNAYTRTMGQEIIAAMDDIDADDAVRAVIFTGAGERAFCAGADLTPEGGGHVFSDPTEVKDLSDPRVRDGGGLLTLRLFESKKPLISACNGVAVGVGATMQLAMDIRLAATTARYGFVFARRGIVPEAASSWFLPRIVGISQALEWCYTGALDPRAAGPAPCGAIACARDCRQHLGDFGRDDPGDDVAAGERRSSDGSPQDRQPRDLPPQPRGRCQGGDRQLPRKAPRDVSGQSQRRHA
jgi:hypothetical protein